MAQILSSSRPRRRVGPWFAVAMLALVVAGAIGGWWWQRQRTAELPSLETRLAAAGIEPQERAAIESLVREYILAHPEILPEAMERLQSKGAARQIAAQGDALTTPFAGAVLGNPRGSLTLVQFTDYACGYCRQSVADLRALAAAHPDLKIVVRELPVLIPASEQAARMALSAARQGRYAAFHEAMFATAKPDSRTIAQAARTAGLDPATAEGFARGEEVSAELSRNVSLARELGIQGTPAWVVGERLLIGAVGRDALERAIAEARAAA